MTFDKELNKKSLGELYYGKENLMNDKKEDLMRIPELEVGREERHMDMEKGNSILSTIHDEELREKTKELMELYGWDINDASQCEKALKEATTMLKIKVKKVKPKRFHVDLSPEMGQDLSDLAEKMGLTLNAVVKLFLMKPWKEYQYYGYDYIYLGVASKPMDEPSYKQ